MPKARLQFLGDGAGGDRRGGEGKRGPVVRAILPARRRHHVNRGLPVGHGKVLAAGQDSALRQRRSVGDCRRNSGSNWNRPTGTNAAYKQTHPSLGQRQNPGQSLVWRKASTAIHHGRHLRRSAATEAAASHIIRKQMKRPRFLLRYQDPVVPGIRRFKIPVRARAIGDRRET